MTRFRMIPALVFAGTLIAALAQAEPAAAYQFTFSVTKFPICNPQIKAGSPCSLQMHAANVAPAVAAPLKVRMNLDVGTALQAKAAGGSGAWSCAISAGGQKVGCHYVGPMPVPAGFTFPPITVRVLSKKPIPGPFLWAPVCGDVGAYQVNVLQPFLAQGCTLVVIIP